MHSIVVAGINSNPSSQCDVSNLKRQRLWLVVESAAEKLTQTEQDIVLLNSVAYLDLEGWWALEYVAKCLVQSLIN